MKSKQSCAELDESPGILCRSTNRSLPDHLYFFVEFEFRIWRYYRNILGKSLGNDLPVKGIVMMDFHSEKLETVICGIGEYTKLKVLNSDQHVFSAVDKLAEFMLDGDLHQRDRAEFA